MKDAAHEDGRTITTGRNRVVNQSLSIEEALRRLTDRRPVDGVETCGLPAALHRVLAEKVVAQAPVPGHDSSAMDGYALRFDDLPADRRMPISGRVAAGHPLGRSLDAGTAVRIFTGGAMPEGADTVAMQEFCSIDKDTVTLPDGLSKGDNRRFAGEDVASGATVLEPGMRLRAQDLGVAAAVGRPELTVYRRPRIALITTGDELRAVGTTLPVGCIYDSNRYTVGAAARGLGALVDDFGIVSDSQSQIVDTLRKAAAANDLIITTGGVSAGEEDHVRPAILELGSLDFWKLPIKPGRPVAVGDINGVPFLGLPGNPVSAMVTFWLLGRPLLLSLAGVDDIEPPRISVVAAFEHRHPPGRREFLRARLGPVVDGQLSAEAYRSSSSGMISSLTWSDGLLEVPEASGDVQRGDVLSYLPYIGLAK